MRARQAIVLTEDILMRGAVWALVGAIFGVLFIMFVEAFGMRVRAPYDSVLATIAAAALTSLFYGSMRLTVLVANFTFIAMLIYTSQGLSAISPEPLIFISAGVGVAVGAAYGLNDKASRVFCAEAKIIAGAVAGGVAGALVLLVTYLLGNLGSIRLAAIVAPVGILTYTLLARWFVSRCHHLLPAVIDGTIVGLGVGVATGLMFVVMAGALDEGLIASDGLQLYAAGVEAQWGEALFSCALACIPVGVFRALVRAPWYNM